MKIELDHIVGAGGGGKSGAGAGAREEPNTLRSKARARFVELLSEGPILGLVDGGKSIFIQKVPYQNPDGTQNFQGLDWEFRAGTADQPALNIVPGIPIEYDVGRQVRNDTPITYRTAGTYLDRVVVTLNMPAVSRLNQDKGVLEGSRADIAIDIRSLSNPDNQWVTDKVQDSIIGKQTGPYERQYEIALPSGDSGPWLIRMRRLSADFDNDASVSNTTYFARITEIIDRKVSYANSSVIGIEVDAEQFSGGADRNYDIDGKLINYPSNYDPVTGNYTGLWDGTWSFGYCKNPAWVFYDLCTNPRYGLDLPDQYIDKWALYSLARYCDTLVPDGFGGMERRFEFNGTLKKADDAYKVLQQVASLMRAIVFYGAGALLIDHDAPKTVRATYSPANIIGNFNYASTAKGVRHNAAVVKWNNPELGYEDDYEIYQDRAAIIKHGRNIARIEGFATKSRGQAYRQGAWLVLTEQLQTETVTFEAGLDSADRLPGDLIEVADHHKVLADFAGRLRQPEGRNLAPPRNLISQATTADGVEVGEVVDYENFSIPPLITLSANPGSYTPYYRFPSGAAVIGDTYTISMFVNPGKHKSLFFGVVSGKRIAAKANFTEGTIDWKTPDVVKAGMVHVSEGVYRVWLSFVATSANAQIDVIIPNDKDMPVAYATGFGQAIPMSGTESIEVGGFMREEGSGRPSIYEVRNVNANTIVLDRPINYIGSGRIGLTLIDGALDDITGVTSNNGRPIRRKITYFTSNISSYDPTNRIVTLQNAPVEDDKQTPIVWVYSSATVQPKPYIVVDVEPSDGETSFNISALEYSAEKFVRLDEGFNITFGDEKYSDLPETGTCPPPRNLRASLITEDMQGIPVRKVLLTYERPKNYPYISHYIVSYLGENGNSKTLPPTTNEAAEIDWLYVGAFRFTVRAVNVFGNVSMPATTQLDTREEVDPNRTRITGLTSDLGTNQFTDKDLRLFWLSTSIQQDVTTSSIFGSFMRSGGTVEPDDEGLEVTGSTSTSTGVEILVDTADPTQPMITLSGTVGIGDSVTINIGPTEFTATATTTSIPALVADLATVIGADVRYGAANVGSTLFVSFTDGVTNANNIAAHDDPKFRRYRLEFRHPTSDTLLRTEYTQVPEFTYTFASNTQDFGSPNRSVKVVAFVETLDGVASQGAEGIFTNPPPSPPGVMFQTTYNSLTLTFTAPTDPDYAGIEVHLSNTSGFEPGPGTLVYKDQGNPTIPVMAGETLYVRYRFFDKFGTDGVAFSFEASVTIPQLGLDDEYIQEILDEINNTISDMEFEIAELVATYGSTASAAASADAAQLAEENAALAQQNAEAAYDLAEAARIASEAARSLAVNARIAAEAAVTDSEAHKVAAGLAEQAAQQAATQAETYATTADGYATAAGGSAVLASAFSDEAEQWAGIAQSNSLSARITAAYLLPSTFEQNGQFWFNSYNGAPETRTPISDTGSFYSFVSVPGEGKVIRFTRGSEASIDVGQIGVVKAVAGRRYRVSVRWRRIVGSGQMRIWSFGLNDAYSVVFSSAISSAPTGTNDVWYEHFIETTGDNVINGGATWIRAGARGQDGNSTYEISFIRFEDITESYKASISASAAFTSSQNAAAHENAAGVSAAASDTSRVQAEAAAASASDAAQQALAVSLPDRYTTGNETNFSGAAQGAPDVISTRESNATLAGFGPVYETSTTETVWAQKSVFSAIPGRVYEVMVEANASAVDTTGGTPQLRAEWRHLNASFSSGSLSPIQRYVSASITETGIVTATVRISDVANSSKGIQAWAPGSVHLRPYSRLILNGGTATIQFKVLAVRDITSRIQAEIAASAAAQQAQIAEAKANEAGSSATAAQTAETNAATHAGLAETYSIASSIAAANAEGFKNEATLAATAAVQSKNDAEGFASAASGHANTASIQAGLAGTSATAAQASATQANTKAGEASTSAEQASSSASDALSHATSASISATAAATARDITVGIQQKIYTSDFNNSVDYWILGYSFSKENLNTAPVITNAPAITTETVAGIGKVLQSANYYASFSERQTRPIIEGQIVQLSLRTRLTTETISGTHGQHFFFAAHDASGAYIGYAILATFTGLTVADGWVTRTLKINPYALKTSGGVWVGTSAPRIDTAEWRIMLSFNRSGNVATQQIQWITLDDITALEGAQAAASAASTSESNAAASATTAGQHATAANTSRTQAQTAAGQASTSAGQASSSATTAQGHANTASIHATAASQSAGLAGGSATAAANSASTATTKATEAGNSATAANTSSVSASTSATASRLSLAKTFPETLDPSVLSTYHIGSPESLNPINNASWWDNGTLLPPLGTYAIAHIAVLPNTVGELYEAVSEVGATVGTSRAILYIYRLDSDYASVGGGTLVYAEPTPGTRAVLKARFGNATGVAGAINTAGGAFLRIVVLINRTPGTSTGNPALRTRVVSLFARNVTSEAAAGGSATAANTSAVTAGQHATTAQQNATTAATYRDQAQTHASTAQGHASNASSSAAAASSSANLSASYATDALMVGGNLRFEDGTKVGWSNSMGSADNKSANTNGVINTSYQGRSNVFLGSTGIRVNMYSWKKYPLIPGAAYKLRAGFRINGTPGANGVRMYMGIQCLDEAGAAVGTNTGLNYYLISGTVYTTTGWRDIVTNVTADTISASRPGTAQFRLITWLNYGNNANASVALDYLEALDATSENEANAAATISQNASVVATNQAAAAQQSATLSAQINSNSINGNPNFINWGSTTLPAGYDRWSTSIPYSKVASPLGGNAVRCVVAAAATTAGFRFQTNPNTTPAGYYVIEVTASLVSGSFVGAAVGPWVQNAAGTNVANLPLRLWQDPSSSGAVITSPVANRIYRWSKLVNVTNTAASWSYLYAFVNYSAVGGTAVKTIDFHRVALRVATQEEIAAGVALPQLQANVTTQGNAISTLQGQYASLNTTVGTHTSQITQALNASTTANQAVANLSTTVSTNNVTVTNQLVAVNNSIGTLMGRAAVKVDVGGRITGWETNNNGQSGNFIIHSDFFSIQKPGGGARTEFSNGNWRVYDANNVLRVRLGVY